MEVFSQIEKEGLEQLIFFSEESVGLKGILAIHNTTLGPAIAGVRYRDYGNEQEMYCEAADLAWEMTLRATLANCDLGGAAVVLQGHSGKPKTEAYFRMFGRILDGISRKVHAIVDVGVDEVDLKNVRRECNKVLALPKRYGGLADPTAVTADGIILGIRAAIKHKLNTTSFAELTFLVQGAGRLGVEVIKRIAEEKGRILVSDLSYDKVKAVKDAFPNADIIHPKDVISAKCDVLVPCAIGNVITSSNVNEVRTSIIAGGASGIIPDNETADLLHKRDILYVPHYLIDAGELILADTELKGHSEQMLLPELEEIYLRTLRLLDAAKSDSESPAIVCIREAKRRIQIVSAMGRMVRL